MYILQECREHNRCADVDKSFQLTNLYFYFFSLCRTHLFTLLYRLLICHTSLTNKKVKVGKCIYIARFLYITLKALRHGSHSVTCNYTNACLYLVSVHQMAPPQTGVAHI